MRSACSRSMMALLAVVLLSQASTLNAQTDLAIQGGRILTMAGEPIENGVILIREGKIQAVGKDLKIPTEAKVIDASGMVITPGLIEAHTSRGMDQTNERNATIPFASVVDGIDPSRPYFEECRRNGVTTVCVVPGHNTMLSGQAAIIKTAGDFVDEMIVKRDMGIKVSLKPGSNRSRMSHLSTLRQELLAARELLEKNQTAKSAGKKQVSTGEEEDSATQPPAERPDRPTPPPSPSNAVDTQIKQKAIGKLLKGELLAFIYCNAPMDVARALELIKTNDLKPVLVLEKECYKAVKEVAASKLPVILEPELVFWETNPRTGEDKKIVLPKIYQDAGVPITFQTTGSLGSSRRSSLPTLLGTNYLWYQAATAVKYGMPLEEGFKAITVRPAQILGIEKTCGSIEPGKDADLVLFTGDPLKIGTWVSKTLVRGKVVYDRSKDTKLKDLLDPSLK